MAKYDGKQIGPLEVQDGDQNLFERLENLLAEVETDMTIFYRCLANDNLSLDSFAQAYYQTERSDQYNQTMNEWLNDYTVRRQKDERDSQERINAMNSVNPMYVFRNYLAQQAIELSEAGDHSMINELLDVLRNPYTEQKDKSRFAQKRPEWARSKIGCSMLSCSS